VVDQIASVKKNSSDLPFTPVVIEKAVALNEPEPKVVVLH
jgi:hypothetical protein